MVNKDWGLFVEKDMPEDIWTSEAEIGNLSFSIQENDRATPFSNSLPLHCFNVYRLGWDFFAPHGTVATTFRRRVNSRKELRGGGANVETG